MGNMLAMIALLGRRDTPTDALRDYCHSLAGALSRRGSRLEAIEVSWDQDGFPRALLELWRKSKHWRGRWVLVQYTALSWSRRGFPLGYLGVLFALRWNKARIAIVFHDTTGFHGERLIDRIRRGCQQWVMRRGYDMASVCIFTIPPDRVRWLRKDPDKATFVPIGANVPSLIDSDLSCASAETNGAATVAVFGVTEPPNAQPEVETIAYVMRQVAQSRKGVRLLVFGRGAEAAGEPLREALQNTPLTLDVRGILEEQQVTDLLASSDALLFVRGQLSGRRGSALAGVACGLPLIGYAGPETAFPITEAGVELVPQRDREAMARALIRVLADERHREKLRKRSLYAQENYFSWDKIAESLERALDNE
jgi:glycosyltransferase involved in cell wall biosynthesis